MEFVVPFVTGLGKLLWSPIQNRINYLVRYEGNIREFGKRIAALEAKKTDLQRLVEESERRFEEPNEEVKKWLKDAEEIEDAKRRIDGEVGENKKWLRGRIPNFSSRYKISKEAANKSVETKELLDSGRDLMPRESVSRPLPPPSVVLFPSDGIMGSTAMERAVEHVMQALEDKNVTAIGVFGMGGVGKTTLMKIVNNEPRTGNMFKKVIMVIVSSNPDLKTIQNEIAHRLGLEETRIGTSLHERANNLSNKLKEEGSVLIILDDCWKRLELSDVGIPMERSSSHIKIIITTRSESVCRQMKTKRNIKMNLLSDEDSWALFKEKAGDVVDFPSLKSLAEQVLRDCKGLPLAIRAVGLTLANVDNSFVWKDALNALNNSVPGNLEGEEVASMISSLRFSYEYLKNDDIKQCFLFCCLFPEDHIIHISYLLIYGIGEGFFDTYGLGMEETTNRVRAIVQRLKNCGLLLEVNKKMSMTMHDVVRDVAITIAKQDGHGFMVKARSKLKGWPLYGDHMKQCKRISLMMNDISELPSDQLMLPNLRTLLLQGNSSLRNIPSDFFNSMPSLVVLDLSYTDIRFLPQSLSSLVNLRTLCMNGCMNLEDVSIVGGLKSLQVLTLDNSGVRELPRSFAELSHLKILVLTGSSKLQLIPSDILSKLCRLEILQMDGVPAVLDDCEGSDKSGSEVTILSWISEIASLQSLTELFVGPVMCGKCSFGV